MFKVATHYPVIATPLFFKILLFMSVSVELCITTKIKYYLKDGHSHIHTELFVQNDDNDNTILKCLVCQPLLEMLVLWGNEQNDPIWTLNGAREGQRIAPVFFCQFL